MAQSPSIQEASNILKKYWGYDSFRPLQYQIVESVLNGRDTLALLPTGGGKSICFQVPALLLPGVCIVISPLIALMKDQVENLRKRGIDADMINSVMQKDEIEEVMNRCFQERTKFLYISPERLANESFSMQLKELKCSMLAIDEAHCISQWGYDFRPAYLQISQIRVLMPDTPVIALTATATLDVCSDICKRLLFKKNHQIFSKSFVRSNLHYIVRKTDDKYGQLLRIISKIDGSAIVYVKSRKRTSEISNFLNKNGIIASYYHAGLNYLTRNTRQQWWIEGQTRVMVCTNAFGMGIDKPDVRLVIHMDMPDAPEAYFQEAGRAGRDEQKAYAVLLCDESDKLDLIRKQTEVYPGFDTVKAIYNWIGNFLQLAVGSGEFKTYPFNMAMFCRNYNLKPSIAMLAIRYLEREGLFTFQENHYAPSRIKFIVDKEAVYEFEFRNPQSEILIKTLLRSYSGIFNEYAVLQEFELAKRLQTKEDQLTKMLEYLNKSGIVHYTKSTDSSVLYFNVPRQHPDQLMLSKKNYEDRVKSFENRIKYMIHYAFQESDCRSEILVQFFGETDSIPCGNCDVCINKSKEGKLDIEKSRNILLIKDFIQNHFLTTNQLLDKLQLNPDFSIQLIRELIDEQVVREQDNGILLWNHEV